MLRPVGRNLAELGTPREDTPNTHAHIEESKRDAPHVPRLPRRERVRRGARARQPSAAPHRRETSRHARGFGLWEEWVGANAEASLALALVAGALEQLPLLVLAHLLAPLLDHVTHGVLLEMREDG